MSSMNDVLNNLVFYYETSDSNILFHLKNSLNYTYQSSNLAVPVKVN